MQASHLVKFFTLSGRELNAKDAKTWYKQATGDTTGKKMANLIGGKIIKAKWEENVLYQKVGFLDARCTPKPSAQKNALKSILQQLRDPDEDGNYLVPGEEELGKGKKIGSVTYYENKKSRSRRRSR